MFKKRASTVIVFALAIVVYVLTVTLVDFDKYVPGWVGFGFTIGAMVVSLAVSYIAFLRKRPLSEKFFSIPLINILQWYIIGQLAFSVLIFVINAFVETLPLWPVLLICIVIAVTAIGILVVAFNVRSHIIETDNEAKAAIKKMTMFSINVSGIHMGVSDPVLRKKLERLSEDFKYSDPVSSPDTEEIERVLAYEVGVLQTTVSAGDVNVISSQADRVSTLLAERNRICKVTK